MAKNIECNWPGHRYGYSASQSIANLEDNEDTVPDRESRKLKVLFFAEAVTLAHVARPAVLSQAISSERFEIYFAADPRYNHLFPELPGHRLDIWSISSDEFMQSLAKGRPLYSSRVLERYVDEDLDLMRKVKPDVIVGDFRLSLSVSARLMDIPYLTISNAYWSRYASNRYVVPQLPLNRFLGVSVSQRIFDFVRPLAFALHCVPLNMVRKRHALSSLGFDLRSVYTDADMVLLADIREIFPTGSGSIPHRYLGPLTWSPGLARPYWWNSIDKARPIIYLTIGSSGEVSLFPKIISALARWPVTVIAATAGRIELDTVPENVMLADYVPGREAAEIASLVICNGGSLTTYQAIQGGTPVLGIASNLDQYLNMSYLARAGIGEVMRSEWLDEQSLVDMVNRLLGDRKYTAAAEENRMFALQYDPGELFRQAIDELSL